VEYICLCFQYYKVNKCGLSWYVVLQKAREYAAMEKVRQPEKYKDLKGSTRWLCKVLKCHNLAGKALHGEAAEMSEEDCAAKMSMFLTDFHQKIEKWNITLDCLYNA